MEILNDDIFDKHKNENPNKQINLNFNINDKKDYELYLFLKKLPNTTATLKELANQYKMKEENKEAHIKNMLKEYMSTRDFNNNLKASLKSNDMTNFLKKIIEEIVVEEVKNYHKYSKK